MAEELSDADRLRRELDYYKKRVNELAGAQLKLEYTIPALRHELAQKRQGFALLSQLQQAIGAHTQISSIFDITLTAINSTLGMDRTVILTQTERANVYRPSQWAGFREDLTRAFSTAAIEFPPDLPATRFIIANAAAETTPLVEQIRSAFELPFFIAVPIRSEGGAPIGIIVSGRTKEARPMYPALDQGDIDTFQAIAGLIAATVQNMRVAVLQETDRLKTEFFANISHEFRTPITLTLGPLEQLVSGRYGPLSDAAREQVGVMLRNQHRLLGLVSQILDLAKLEAGQMTMKAAPAPNVNRFVRDRAEEFRTAMTNRDVELRVSLDDALQGADLYIDREKFDKLLFNLLSNAYKFTKKGSIEVATQRRGDAFEVSVSDTGIGIEKDQLPFIFDRFRQADSGASREYGGTGLGLALVKEVAKLHGGDVTVRSQAGRGTTFTVLLPFGRTHLDPATIVEHDDEEMDRGAWQRLLNASEDRADRGDVDEVNARTAQHLDSSRATILYAEDNPDLRRYVYELLSESHNVLLAEDGSEGLAIAKRHRPDLILTDFMMPHVSGREFLQSIREDESLRSTPVVFLTARAGTAARIESLEAGADDYLTKPFDQGELLARIRNLLKAREQERELARLNARLEAQIGEQLQELVRTGELKRFLPASLVRSLMSGEISAQKPFQRRKITSLAIGISDFADLTETLEAEDLAAIVNDSVREITALAIGNGGTVDKIVADTIFVMFGAPEEMPLDEQAKAALETALEFRRRLPTLSRNWRHLGVTRSIAMHAGINTGYCTVGVFGSELQSSYTAIGEPIIVATRLRTASPRGSILLGAPTQALVQGAVVAEGPKTLSGSLHPLHYYEITAAAPHEPAAEGTVVRERVSPGSTIAQFKVVSRLGGGGMGEVFLAEDQKLGRRVALKIAPPEITKDATVKARFFLEARSASALNHANIAHIYDMGEAAGVTFIAMEYIDGVTLRNKIGGVPIDIADLLDISVQVSAALQEAHHHGVVHRDIKPENIMITPRGQLKVLDFGLAKVIRNGDAKADKTEQMLTRPGLVMGTVHYMSPEQALGREIDFRSDIFSFGVLMYEMATGRLPFSGATTPETIDLIVHAEPASLSRFNCALPREIEHVIRKCLQKSPTSRYQSTADLVVDLRNAQRGS